MVDADVTWQRERVPPERLPTIEMMRAMALRNPMVALLEVEIGKARALIAGHAAATGERLSFSAFVIGCVARSVAEHPRVHAMRRGKHTYVCDRVDVATMVEVDAGGYPAPVLHVLRDAGGRSVRSLHDEIRAVQSHASGDLRLVRRRVRWLSRVPKPLRWVAWRVLARSPRRWQRLAGTVAVSPVGMFGGGRAWGMAVASFPVSVTVGGIHVPQDRPDAERLCLTVVLDHDVIDGAPAARFVASLRDRLESAAGLEDVEVATLGHDPVG